MTTAIRRTYDDIIDLPRHVSPRRAPMSLMGRAAQFAPFAALSGYEDAVQDTARLAEQRFEREPEDPMLYWEQERMCE